MHACIQIPTSDSKAATPGTTFQLKETESIFCCFPLKAQAHIFLCTAGAECLAGNIPVHASNKTPSPSSLSLLKHNASCWDAPHTAAYSSQVLALKPFPAPPQGAAGLEERCSEHPLLWFPCGNHKPGASRSAVDPPLPSCISLQQKLHVKVPLEAAVDEQAPTTQFIYSEPLRLHTGSVKAHL